MENGYIQGFFLMVFLYGFSLLRFILSNGYLQILTIIALIAIFVVAYKIKRQGFLYLYFGFFAFILFVISAISSFYVEKWEDEIIIGYDVGINFAVFWVVAFYIFAMYLLIKGYRVSKEKERGFYEN